MYIRLISFYLGLLSALVAAEPTKLPIRNFFRSPTIQSPTVSPNGRFVAYINTTDFSHGLAVFDLETKKTRTFEPSSHEGVAWCHWAGNDRILFGMREEIYASGGLFAVDPDGQNLSVLVPTFSAQYSNYRRFGTSESAPITCRLLLIPEDDPENVYVEQTRYGTGNYSPSVYRINVRTGIRHLVEDNSQASLEWILDRKGNVRISVQQKKDKILYLHRPIGEKRWKPLFETTVDGPTFGIAGFHADGENLYVLSNRGRETDALVLYSTRTKEFGQEIFSKEGFDLGFGVYMDSNDNLSELYYETDKPQKEIFDAQLKSKHRSIDKALPGRFNSVYSRSRSGDVAVIRSMSDREPGEFFIANLDKLSMSQLGRARPWFSENKLAPMQPIQFKARDGITLNGYLTLPLGKDPKNLPFVMLPHGGPWLRDSWGFDEEVQFLANRGYGVLQVNFRGSTGYGRKLFEAGLKQWGTTMQDDITDGVKWLISEGYADSKRIAIYGGSYGGYAALAGLCFTPEVYRCGISLCGVSDIYTQFRESAGNNRYLKLFVARAVGDLSKERPELKARSPLENTDKIVVPVLLAHGDKDPIVDVNQTIRMVRELKKRDKEVEFIRKENEGHGFRLVANKVEFYGAMEQFLAKHLGEGQ